MAQARSSSTPRLPSTRESRPALIGLAILLIVGGALASGYLALQAGNRSSFVMVQRGVAPGAQITKDDLGRVSLPEGYGDGVRASQADTIVGQSAKVQLLPGTVLIPGMVSRSGGIKTGNAQLTIPQDSSSFVNDLPPGAKLALNIGSSGSGDQTTRQSIYARLDKVIQSNGGGGIAGGSTSSTSLLVTINGTCLSLVSQAVEDQAVKTALVSSPSGITTTCRG